jgi:hypothetical protein
LGRVAKWGGFFQFIFYVVGVETVKGLDLETAGSIEEKKSAAHDLHRWRGRLNNTLIFRPGLFLT